MSRPVIPSPIRSLLFVPGNRRAMIEKSWTTGADALIFDLEDSVPDDAKDEARELVRAELHKASEPHPFLLVRINATRTSHWQADVQSVVGENLFGLLIPKCESFAALQELKQLLEEQERAAGMSAGSIRVFLLIETAKGLLAASRLAESSARIAGLAFGAEDFRLDMGLAPTPDGREVFFARSYLAIVARATECLAIDSVYTHFRDSEGLRRETQLAKELGYNAKLAVHPQQIPIIHEVFRPTEKEIDEARRVVEAFAKAEAAHTGVVSLDGKMIDKPIVDRARRLLILAESESR